MRAAWFLLIFTLPSHLMALPIEELESKLKLGKEHFGEDQTAEVSAMLSQIISGDRVGGRNTMEQLRAVDLAGKHKLMGCLPALIDRLDKVTPHFYHGFVSWGISYPCLAALVDLGEAAVPALTETIGQEDVEIRLRLMAYALMGIRSKQGALGLLDACMTSAATDAQRERYRAAKREVEKWTIEMVIEPPEVRSQLLAERLRIETELVAEAFEALEEQAIQEEEPDAAGDVEEPSDDEGEKAIVEDEPEENRQVNDRSRFSWLLAGGILLAGVLVLLFGARKGKFGS